MTPTIITPEPPTIPEPTAIGAAPATPNPELVQRPPMTSGDVLPSQPVIRRSLGAKSGINLLGDLEKWALPDNQRVTEASLKFNGISIKELRELCTKLPPKVQAELQVILPPEGGPTQMISSNPEWVSLILGKHDAASTWQQIFSSVRDIAIQTPKPGALDRATVAPDRLLANCAWNLWADYLQHAPLVVDELKKFWVSTTSSGTAVLVLDGLSLRELPLIVSAAKGRGVTPARVEAFGAQVPTETDRFAEALGLSSRSKLYNNKAPSSFIFGGPDTFASFLDAPFGDCVGSVTSHARVFFWHSWPDEPLIHGNASKDDGPEVLAAQTKQQLFRPVLELRRSSPARPTVGHHFGPRICRQPLLL